MRHSVVCDWTVQSILDRIVKLSIEQDNSRTAITLRAVQYCDQHIGDWADVKLPPNSALKYAEGSSGSIQFTFTEDEENVFQKLLNKMKSDLSLKRLKQNFALKKLFWAYLCHLQEENNQSQFELAGDTASNPSDVKLIRSICDLLISSSTDAFAKAKIEKIKEIIEN